LNSKVIVGTSHYRFYTYALKANKFNNIKSRSDQVEKVCDRYPMPNYYILSCENMMDMYRRLFLIHHRKPSCKHS